MRANIKFVVCACVCARECVGRRAQACVRVCLQGGGKTALLPTWKLMLSSVGGRLFQVAAWREETLSVCGASRSFSSLRFPPFRQHNVVSPRVPSGAKTQSIGHWRDRPGRTRGWRGFVFRPNVIFNRCKCANVLEMKILCL